MAEAQSGVAATCEDSSGSDTKVTTNSSGTVDNSLNTMTDQADDAALQRFLQQQRNDLMFELRRIKHGERPVTGQSHRENIASFIAKHLPGDSGEGTEREGHKNVPANTDAVEEHRPEAVVVEVQGVFEQRRVSSMLQTNNFRRHLENIIRGSLSAVRDQRTPQPRNSAAVNAGARSLTPVQGRDWSAASQGNDSNSSTASSGTSGSGDASNATSAAAGSVAVPLPASNRQGSFTRVTPQPSPRQSLLAAIRERTPPTQSTQPSHNPEPQLQPPQVQQSPLREEGRQLMAISEIHREEMVYEISELLHRRLVSSTLGSEFRGHMEVHLQNHLQQTEMDGEAVAEYIRNIPQSEIHVPNDFSHLGIAPGPRDDNSSDSISITGISATAVPYTQTNLHMKREIQSLKSQMEEMKNMMRLSFDLQLDIQRAIRQEVAAALATVTAQGATAAAAAAPTIQSTPVNDTHCLICLESHSDCVFYQCGHLCVCYACGMNLLNRENGKCPVCRAQIKDVIRAYKTNVD